MKTKVIIVLLIGIFVVLVTFSIRLFSGEDNWLCVNGEWVKHGRPSASPPAKTCGSKNVVDVTKIDAAIRDYLESTVAAASGIGYKDFCDYYTFGSDIYLPIFSYFLENRYMYAHMILPT